MDASTICQVQVETTSNGWETWTTVQLRGVWDWSETELAKIDEQSVRDALSYGAGLIARVAATMLGDCNGQRVMSDPPGDGDAPVGFQHSPWTIAARALDRPHDDWGDAPGFEVWHPRGETELVRQRIDDVLGNVMDSEQRIVVPVVQSSRHELSEPDETPLQADQSGLAIYLTNQS